MFRTTMFRVAVVAAVTLILAACGGGDDESSAPGGDPGGSPQPVVDWAGDYAVDLGDGWQLTPCEGGPTLMCIRLNGETQGVAELLTYPTAGHEAVKEVLDAGGTNEEALAALAADFQEVFIEDRPVGCGAEYAVEPFGPRPATVGGLAGVIYGFEGLADGRRVERALQFAAFDGPTVYLIATTAIEDGSCMDDGELQELTIAEIDDLEQDLAGAIATSRLPAVEWCEVPDVGLVPCDTAPAGG